MSNQTICPLPFILEVIQFLQVNSIRFEQRQESLHLIDSQVVIYCIQLNSAPIVEENLPINFRQIHLWEDVWQTKKAICQSRILAIAGMSIRISARQTKAQRIDKATLDNFLLLNHLQVPTNAKFKYGLFLPANRVSSSDALFLNPESRIPPLTSQPNDLLVAVASFSSARKFIRNQEVFRSFELVRFANLRNHTVVGGLDKLLQHFIREQQPDDIMTYADRDWSNGQSYKKVGFESVEITSPQEFWVNNETLERYYPNELQSFDNQHFTKVYNSGNIKFLMKIKK